MAFDPSVYSRARQGINSDFAAKSAANLYARQLSQTRGSREIGDLRKQYTQRTPGFVASYAQRGLTGPGVSSGVYTNALQRYAASNMEGIQGVRDRMAQDENQFSLSQAQLANERQSALFDLQRQKRAEIAAAAAQLAAFQQFNRS